MNNQKLKNIFEKEIRRHTKEIKEHKELAKNTKSKQQQRKADKHFHKLFQTKLLAKQLGLDFCECCGALRY